MTENRMCTAVGVEGTCKFHCWGQRAFPIEPSPMIGGAPGGQISYPVAILETEGGRVEVVIADDVTFAADKPAGKNKADEPTDTEQTFLDDLCRRCARNDDPAISDGEIDTICGDCTKRVHGVWALTHYKSREVVKL